MEEQQRQSDDFQLMEEINSKEPPKSNPNEMHGFQNISDNDEEIK